MINFRKVKYRLWLCLTPFLSYLFDDALTLMGQTASYWQGDYLSVIELNPVNHWFLSLHPLAYFTFDIVSFCILAFMIISLPLELSKILSLYVVISNTYAGFSWLRDVFQMNILIRYGLLLIPTVLVIYAFDQIDKFTEEDPYLDDVALKTKSK
jgi:hypothetical protein